MNSEIRLPTYQHVLECELELMTPKFVLQSDPAPKRRRNSNGFNFGSDDQYEDEMPHIDEDSCSRLVRTISGVTKKIRAQFTDKQDTWVLDTLEEFFQLVYWHRRSKTKGDILMNIGRAAKALTGKGVASHIWDAFKTSNLQDDSITQYIRDARTMWTLGASLINNPLVAKLRNVYTYLLVQGFLKNFGQEMSPEEFLKLNARTKVDFTDKTSMLAAVVETALTIMERLDAYRTTGDWRALVHDDAAYASWTKEAERILALAPFTSNLAAHGTTYFSFISDLNESIDKGEAVCRYSSKVSGTEMGIMRKRLNMLKMLKNVEITRRSTQKERRAPFGVLVHGKSKVGKSSFTKMLYYYFGKLHGLDIDDHFRYVRNPADEYWSGFDSSKWCIQMDDVAFRLPSKSSDIDPTLNEIIMVVNNVPFTPPQAALEDKGKTPVVAKLVVATSNVADLNAQDYFSCPLAVRRRLPFVVHVEPKDEYKDHTGHFIDPKKLPPIQGAFPDFWKITVQELEAVDHNGRDSARLVDKTVYTDVREFLKYFAQKSHEHEGTQDGADACDTEMKDLKVCRLCFEVGDKCNCLQSGVALSAAQWIMVWMWALFADLVYHIFRNLITIGVIQWMATFYGPRLAMARLASFLNKPVLEFEVHAFFNRQNGGRVSITIGRLMKIGSVVLGLLVVAYTTRSFANGLKKRNARKVLSEATIQMAEDVEEESDSESEDEDNHIAWKDLKNAQYKDHGMGYKLELLAMRRRYVRYLKRAQDRGEAEEIAAWEAALKQLDLLIKANEVVEDRMATVSTMKLQGNVLGTTETQLKKEETQNVWYQSTIELSSFDVPTPSKSLANIDDGQVRDLFAQNCVHVIVEALDVKQRIRTGGVFLRGQFLCLNRHALKNAQRFKLTIVCASQHDGLSSNAVAYASRSEFREKPDRDLAVVKLSAIPPRKDILKFWNETSVPASMMISIKRERSGNVTYNTLYNVMVCENFPVEAINQSMDIYMGISGSLTQVGDCGSLGVAKTPQGPIIIGFHTVGHEYNAGFPHVTKQELLDLCSEDLPLTVEGGGAPMLSLHSEVQLVEPHYKSVFRYLPEGTLNVYGTFPGFRPKPRSRVTSTPLQATMLEHFQCTVNYGPPVMEGWEPVHNNVKEMVKPHTDIDQGVLDHCVEQFSADIVRELDAAHGIEWKGELVFLSERAAINGLPGVKFIDRININTSMGHPWHTQKKKYLIATPTPEYPDGVDFTQEVWDRVSEIKAKYAVGQRAYPVFTGHLKDEATSLAKIQKKKTRVFTGAPIDWSLVVRSHLLSFVRLLQKNKFIFEAGPGTVTQSIEWTRIYDYLVVHGEDRIVAGDYGKFDKRMIAPFVLAAFRIIVNVHKEAGFSSEELRTLMCIGYDTAFPLTNVGGDLVEFFGTNPSGHPLTVVINSLANSLYMRYTYCMLNPEGRNCAGFKSDVSLMTYGDDNIMGVSSANPWFNHTAIQSTLAQIGVEYTMADKEAESKPFISISECSFLKRSWRYEPELDAYMGPLEEDSIHKSLTMWVPSKTIDKYAQMVSVISSANSEYFFFGREVFERHHAFFKKVLECEPYHFYVKESTLPDWDTLIARWKKASEKL
jgi:hypothetical protein